MNIFVAIIQLTLEKDNIPRAGAMLEAWGRWSVQQVAGAEGGGGQSCLGSAGQGWGSHMKTDKLRLLEQRSPHLNVHSGQLGSWKYSCWSALCREALCVLSCFSPIRLFATLWTVACQAPVHGILQAEILEGVALPSSRRSSQPRDWTYFSYISCSGRRVLYH